MNEYAPPHTCLRYPMTLTAAAVVTSIVAPFVIFPFFWSGSFLSGLAGFGLYAACVLGSIPLAALVLERYPVCRATRGWECSRWPKSGGLGEYVHLPEPMVEEQENELGRQTQISHAGGVPWYEAPPPPIRHRCWVQTRGWVNYLTLVERCACGAIRMDRDGWLEKNSDRKREARA